MSAFSSSAFSSDELEERRRADVAVGPQVGDRVHLHLGLAGAAGNHRAAERVRAGLDHRAGRREVVGEAVVHEIAGAKAGGEERARDAPVVAPRALRVVDRAGRGEDARPSFSAGGRVQAAERRRAFCSSPRSDLRVTGSCASARAIVIAARIDALEDAREGRRVLLAHARLAAAAPPSAPRSRVGGRARSRSCVVSASASQRLRRR